MRRARALRPVLAVRDRWWNRDRSRRVSLMLQRERIARVAQVDWVEAMAVQLAEIRMLPEVPDRRRF